MTRLSHGKSADRADRSQAELAESLHRGRSPSESSRLCFIQFFPTPPPKSGRNLASATLKRPPKNGELKNLEWGGLKPGTKLGELAPIFPRAPKELIQLMTDMENNTNTPPKPEPSKLVDEKTTHTSRGPTDPTHPGAPPRTSAIEEPNPGAQVGGSHAISTERTGTPSHTEAPASGAFATSAAGFEYSRHAADRDR